MKSKIKTIRTYLLVAAIVLSMLSAAVELSQAITNGRPDGDAHPYVGAVHNEVYFCSGAAISPKVFVTAAHCFFEWGDEVEVWVTFHPEPFLSNGSPNPDATYHEGTWYPHPDFCLGCGPGLPRVDSHDVAVVVFDDEVFLPEYAQLPIEGLVDTLPRGTDVTLVGYGAQGFVVGSGPPAPFFLRQRYNAPSNLIPSKHVHSDEYIKLTANPAQGKGGECFGDSGGPNLLGDTNTILAITSYGANPMCAGVGYSNRIDTSYAIDFINSFLP